MSRLEKTWIDIGALDDIPVRRARVVKTPVGCLAVFRGTENEVFAIEDRCPHEGGPLRKGIVHGGSVTCPLHNWVIDLESDEAQGADEGRVKTFALKLEGGRILLESSAVTAAVTAARAR